MKKLNHLFFPINFLKKEYKMNEILNEMTDKLFENGNKFISTSTNSFNVSRDFLFGTYKYLNAFSEPFIIALESFNNLEKKKIVETPIMDTMRDYYELFQFNCQIAQKGIESTITAFNEYHVDDSRRAFSAFLNTIFNNNGDDLASYTSKKAKLMHWIVNEYPEAIKNVKPEYGFHFDSDGYNKIGETDRMVLYEVLPTDKSVNVDPKSKPILIIPPYVLGANILCFLPNAGKSYVHAYANEGIPTYIRIMKNIDITPAVQTMTPEDDTLDTQKFCEILKKKHGCQVTLNGFCQGGFVACLSLLSGKLDDLVDAFTTCVAPMDGTRSLALVEYLKHIPPRFRDLGYAVKTLPNGNEIVDGKVMSWVYKLKSMEKEAPLFTFFSDMIRFSQSYSEEMEINKTAAAINYWLIYDRTDLPKSITKLSFDSYTIPVAKDGTLPVKLFGQKLNFKRLKEKNIKYLMCIAETDELVDRPAALAPLDFVDAELTVFPKGHGAIATSWSQPGSKCALHKKFGKNYRGPVLYQLDLNKEKDKKKSAK